MDVERIREDILDYLSGVMDAARRAEFEARLGEDPRLARFVRQHLRVDEILDALPNADPSAERLSRMAEAVLKSDARRRSSSAPLIERTARVLGFPRLKVAAAAAVLIGVGLYAWSALGPDPAMDTETGVAVTGAPDFLEDPEFVEDFEVIRDLQVLREFGDELTLPDDEALLDVVTLQVLSGA